MKIIGKTERGFILEAEANEVANLLGFYWVSEHGMAPLAIGSQIDTTRMYTMAREMSAVRGSLKDAVKTLRAAADIVDREATVVVQPVPIEDV